MSILLHFCRFSIQTLRRNSKISYVHGASTSPLKYETVGQSLRCTVEAQPQRDFVVFKKQNIRKSYEDFYADARRFAAGLYALGLEKGDRVGIWGGNYYEWTVCQLATALAGMIQVNINPAYKSSELHYALKTVGVRALITPHKFKNNDNISILTDVCPSMVASMPGVGSISSKDLPKLEHIIVFGNEEPIRGAWNFPDIWNGAGQLNMKRLEEIEATVQPDDVVNIQYTSGTTGLPKAATLSHMNIRNNAGFMNERMHLDQEHNVICLPNPLYHCFACVMGVLAASICGNTCVFPDVNFNVKEVLKAIEEEKCGYIYGTPTMFIDILSHPDFKKHDLSSVTGGLMAGSPCPTALCAALQKEMGVKNLFIGYGSTELSPLVTFSRPEQPIMERIKNVGHVMPHCEIKIVDEKGMVVPRGEKGELLARGYMTISGYWGDEEKTKEVINSARWYQTGDVATMDEDGAICIVGRSKDMIIKGGENIYPVEIEQFLFKLPYVADAQVIGVPDDRLGETVCAWIRLRPGMKGKITKEKIQDDCKGNIMSYKIPTYILFKELEDFPLTATGKVQKFKMREISKKELGLERIQPHYNAY